MRFFVKNSYDIVRLFLNQIALAFFGLILFLATGLANDGSVGIFTFLTSIFSVLFYLYILYATLLEMGMKDSIKIESGSLKKDNCKGLKLILWAQVPNMLVMAVMGVGLLLGRAFQIPFGDVLYSFSALILHFLEAMYQGIIQFIIPTAEGHMLPLFLLHVATLIPQIVVCTVSYILGLKNIKLFFGKPPTSDF